MITIAALLLFVLVIGRAKKSGLVVNESPIIYLPSARQIRAWKKERR